MKPSIPSFGINRCGLFSVLAVLSVLSRTVRLADLRRFVVRAVMALLFCFAAGAIEPARAAAAFYMAALGLGISSAHAGPCSAKIAQFELAVRQSAGGPNAGPFGPQSIGAQIDRQPTPASIKRARERAQAQFATTLARAKRLDAQGNRVGCTRALATAKDMYNLQ